MICRTSLHLCLGILASLAVSGVGHAEEQLKIVSTTPGTPPSDAVVFFDGGSTDAFLNVKGTPCQWPVVDRAMVVKDGFIVSKLHFRDAQIHVEFAVPDDGKKGGGAGNSGVYIFGMYEMQILNSYENPIAPKEAVGALYGISPPLVNAARKPGEWQVYDILYTAPRRDEHGKVVQSGAFQTLDNAKSVGASLAAAGEKKVGEPRVTVQRDGDRITHLRIQCSCGQVIDLACVYEAPAATK